MTAAQEPEASPPPPPPSAPQRSGWGGWRLGISLTVCALILAGAALYDRQREEARVLAVFTAQQRMAELSERLDTVSREAARSVQAHAEAERALGQEREAGARAAQRVTELEADRVARETNRAELERRAGDLTQALAQRDADLAAARVVAREVEQRASLADERWALALIDIARRDIRLAELSARLEQRAGDASPPVAAPPEPPLVPAPAPPPEAAAPPSALTPEPVPAPPPVEAPPPPRPSVLATRWRAALTDRPEAMWREGRWVLSSDALFRPASAELTVAGKTALDRVAQALREAKSSGDWALRIEGHTDRTPIHTAAFPSNWDLSAARAAAAARRLIESGAPGRRLSVVGFADQQPAAEGDAPAALKQNRRLELSLSERP